MKANLGGARLTRADLTDADFIAAQLHESNLSGATLRRTRLVGVNFAGSRLIGADLTDADLSGADLRLANLEGANLTGANISVSNLIGVNINNVTISKSKIYGVNVWDLDGQFKEQKDLVITREGQSVITVDNIEVAQFVYLILNNKKIRDVIKTIKTLAGLSYFVIADVTNPKSSPLELQATVPDYQIPFVPIIQEGESPFAMMVDLQKKYNWVLPTKSYDSIDTLMKALKPGIIDPAVEMRNKLRQIKAEEHPTESLKDYLDKTL
jgi:hypothetical protein